MWIWNWVSGTDCSTPSSSFAESDSNSPNLQVSMEVNPKQTTSPISRQATVTNILDDNDDGVPKNPINEWYVKRYDFILLFMSK